MYWECRCEGIVKWQIRPKHPLKLFNLAQISQDTQFTAVNEIALVSGPQGRY